VKKYILVNENIKDSPLGSTKPIIEGTEKQGTAFAKIFGMIVKIRYTENKSFEIDRENPGFLRKRPLSKSWRRSWARLFYLTKLKDSVRSESDSNRHFCSN
jgi:hypothetical protein